MSQILYRFYDADERLLYVGITMHLSERWRRHKREKSWIQDVTTIRLEHFESRSDLEAAERYAIQNESPAHNVTYNTKTSQEETYDANRELDRLYLWNEHPQLWWLMQEYISALQSIDSVPSTDYERFMQHLARVDLLVDYCRECDVKDRTYAPIYVNSSGRCLYFCQLQHTWWTYYKAAENLNTPKARI